MELFKIENKKYIAIGMAIIIGLLLFAYNPPIQADNGWITETSDGYYSIGNNIEVKIDILNNNRQSINDSDNLFYNGQKVYIEIKWRAIDTVTTGTSLKLELPVSRNSKQISFESPILNTLELISEDGIILTALKKDGDVLTSFFDAKEQKPIEAGTEGTIIVPHNIFVNSDSSQVLPHTMQVVLTSDGGNQTVIQKQISKVANGIKATNFTLKDQTGKEELRAFDALKNNTVLLNFQYESGSYGIKGGDSLLIKLDNYADGNKIAKLMPYAYETINIKDSKGTTVGTLSFANKLNDDGNTYMRLLFNDAFSNATSIKGSVSILQELNFNNMIKDDSVIVFYANKEENRIIVRGPYSDEKVIENRFDIYLQDLKVLRKNIAINEIDIINESSEMPVQIDNVVLEEQVEYDNYFIDPDSIRITKILAKKENAKDTISSYGLDSATVKTSTGNSIDRIGEDKTTYDARRGLTINEFASYLGETDLITYKKDADLNVTGFRLELGSINERKGINGEYVSVDSKNAITKMPKDGKAFGYLVYYNIIDTNDLEYRENKQKNSGSLKLQIVDKNNSPVGNVQMMLETATGFLEKAHTNKDGFLSFDNLAQGKYVLKEVDAASQNIAPIEFEITDKNQNNLDLAVSTKSREDISYITKIYTGGIGATTESFVNVISTKFEKGRFKIIFRDKNTNDPVPGGEFLIFDKSGYRIEGDLGQIKIQQNGEGISDYLATNEYYFVQSKAPGGYKVDKSKVDVLVTSDSQYKNYEIFAEGEVKLQIVNLSKETKEPIANSEFKIYPYNEIKNPIATITTDSLGHALSDIIPFGKYYLKQVTVNDEYILKSMNTPIEIKSVDISEDGVYRFNFFNELKTEISPTLTENDLLDIEQDDTPLGVPTIIEPEQMSIEAQAISAGDKINPVTGDRFKFQYVVGFATLIVFLFIIREGAIDKSLKYKFKR